MRRGLVRHRGLRRGRAAGQRTGGGGARLGHDLFRVDDEIVPDPGRDLAAGDMLHRAVVVVADPHPDDDVGGEADKPGVAIFVGRPGLAGRAAVEPRRLPGALGDDRFEQMHHVGAVPVGPLGDGLGPGVEQRRRSLRLDRAHHVGFDRFAVGRDRIHRPGHLPERHLGRAERQARHPRQLRLDAEAFGHRDHVIDADRLGELSRNRVQRLGESGAQRHGAEIALVIIPRLPVADLDRLVDRHGVRPVAVAECGQVDEHFEQRAGLAVRLGRAVELAFAIVAAADESKDRAVGRHRDQRGLPDIAASAFAGQPVLDRLFGKILQPRVEGRGDREIERRVADQALNLDLGRIEEVVVVRRGFGRHRQLRLMGMRGGRLRLADGAGLNHCLQHELGAAAGRFQIAARRELRGSADQASQHRRLGEVAASALKAPAPK